MHCIQFVTVTGPNKNIYLVSRQILLQENLLLDGVGISLTCSMTITLPGQGKRCQHHMMGHPNRTFLSSNLFSICQHWTESCSVRFTAHTQMAWQQTVVSLFTVSIGGLTKMSKFIAADASVNCGGAISTPFLKVQQYRACSRKCRLRIQILQSHLVVISIPRSIYVSVYLGYVGMQCHFMIFPLTYVLGQYIFSIVIL